MNMKNPHKKCSNPWKQSKAYQQSMVGRVCKKSKFYVWSEKVKEWWIVKVVTIKHISWQAWHVQLDIGN